MLQGILLQFRAVAGSFSVYIGNSLSYAMSQGLGKLLPE